MSSPALPSLSYAARREVVERIAPSYQQASLAHKTLLLEHVVAVTGYARKYAIRLLNQAPEGKRTIERRRLPRYGPQVRHALVQTWKAARSICAKRLIPALPTLVAALERHGHLQLTSESRDRLLAMSVSTAERCLRKERKPVSGMPTITQAGPLLKGQIPLRTFQQWDQTRPGFLEADLVGHHGGHTQGCFLYTLTLTDIATGWTECLPLLYKSPEAVLAALQQARALFPFPIVGLDTDNGGEFMNELLLAYCEAQQITFTRGRPECKADQCFVEQKNGAIVRHWVGFDRLVGEQAYRQLRELYRALRLYVNCFQPSMKLLSKRREGEHVRRIYDAAKMPLQRLLLSESLSADQQQELREMAQALDPLRLLHQVEQLHQAVRGCAATRLPLFASEAVPDIQSFCLQRCLPGTFPFTETGVIATAMQPSWQREQPEGQSLLDWRRTSRDPFEGQWELILSLVLAHPEWSGGELFQEMQRLFPGRYRPSQQRTLQIGLRKIRARLLDIMQEPWPQDVLQRCIYTAVSADSASQEQEADGKTKAFPAPSVSLAVLWLQDSGAGRPVPPEPCTEEVISNEARSVPSATQQDGEQPNAEPGQARSPLDATLPQGEDQETCRARLPVLSIERAMQSYVQEHRATGRSPKTMEWHETALGLFQHYLVNKRRLCLLCQITQSEVRGWIAHLRTTPSSKDTTRSASTIATYARSARAFCHWLVRKGYLEQTPFVRGTMPKAGRKTIHLIEEDEFERLRLSCHTGRDDDSSGERAAARNRTILWVLLDTGMRVSELCGLRLADVDREQRALRVQSRGGKERWLTLSPNGWFQLLSYLERYRPKEVEVKDGSVEEDHLFLSEWYQPLTDNTLTLLFDRLKKRAGISEKPVSPSVLRDTFAVRYLQAGGELEALRDLLGLTNVAALKRYASPSAHKIEHEQQEEPGEEHSSRPMATPHKSRRRRRSSPTATRNQQRAADRSGGSARKEPVARAEDDP